MMVTPAWPPEAWRTEISALTVGNNTLGQSNSLVKPLLKTPDLQQAFSELADGLVASLLDPGQPAGAAKGLLRGLCTAFADASRIRSIPAEKLNDGSFVPPGVNVATYNGVLEVIDAKALWEAGYKSFVPWPFDDRDLKPDFYPDSRHAPVPAGHDARSFYAACDPVGDFRKVSSAKKVEQLPESLLAGIKEKLDKYKPKNVIVVLDACDNPALWQGATLVTFDSEEMMRQLGGLISGLDKELRDRLAEVYVILPDWSVKHLSVAGLHT